MRSNEYRRLLNEAVRKTALVQDWALGKVEQELAAELNLSQSRIQQFRRGDLPDEEALEKMARFLLSHAQLSRQWLIDFLRAGRHWNWLDLANMLAPEKSIVPMIEGPYANLPELNYGKLIGRNAELQELRRLLRAYPDSVHSIILISGTGGVGKTTLTLELARKYIKDYANLPAEERFEAIIWFSAKETALTSEGIRSRLPGQVLRTLDDLYATIAVTLEREDLLRTSAETQTTIIRRALARQRTLLIVDNLETIDDELLMAFLREPPAPTKLLITSRHQNPLGYIIRLKHMDEASGLTLIQQEADRRSLPISQTEASQLFKYTDGLPLAMVWAIGRIAYGYPPETILRRLHHAEGDLLRFLFEDDMNDICSTDAHRLLVAISMFTTDADRETLGKIAGVAGSDLAMIERRDDGLATLEKLSLVTREGGKYQMAALTREYISGQLALMPDLAAEVEERWILYWYESIVEAPHYSPVYKQVGDILRTFRLLREKHRIEKYFTTWLKVGKEWLDLGQWQAFLVEYGKAIGLAQEQHDRRISAILYDRAALAYWQEQFDLTLQLMREAQSHLDREVDIKLEISITESIGQTFTRMDCCEEALPFLQEAHKKRKQNGLSVWLTTWALGECYTGLNNLGLAEDYLLQSLKLAEEHFEVDELAGKVSSISRSLGQLYLRSEKPDQAEMYLLRSLQIVRELGRSRSQPLLLRLLGEAYTLKNEMEQALHYYVEAKSGYLLLGIDDVAAQLEQKIQVINATEADKARNV